MSLATPINEDRQPSAARPRDAEQTKQLLLRAARRRFAFDGYDATTVRDIATDAGVNVSLINRYFVSKEGLFEACITSAGEQLVRPDVAAVGFADIASRMVEQLVGSSLADDSARLQLLLLLRSSGDERGEAIRRGILRRYAEGLAIAAGWKPGSDEDLVLRAQIAMSTGLGMVLLRSSSDLEPLGSASEAQLLGPMRDVLAALFTPTTAS